MGWDFDMLLFLGFGILSLYLGISGSRLLFWGGKEMPALEKRLGPHYKKIVNISWGVICLLIGIYFMLT